ncbi:hypothetical protein Cdeb_00648 [Caldibacillus debilis GB1]|uniref:Uncharacterized protein n=1 Tax=Caldibacillus debilis GB1 TaxID=1339248 RepID=A0A420VES4_9BACI|nr:hypothetical protein Cdeb_00648 [Caldibacillus debilis GB1]
MVVPMFAPRMMPSDRRKDNSFAEMNPTVMIMTAELLCKMAVIRIPEKNPLSGVPAKRRSHFFIFCPAMCIIP